jgi:glycosyltransferase involved in cell wall biosynthesis
VNYKIILDQTANILENILIEDNGFEIERFKTFQSYRMNDNISSGIIIGGVMRFVYEKNLNLWLQSAKILSQKATSVKFVLIGDGPELSRVKRYINKLELSKIVELIKKLKLENKILLLGHLEYYFKNILITNSKAMILSSHAENFAISLVESLSCARPVLTTYKVNIFNKILKYKAGYVAQENPISFSKILSKFEALNSKEKLQMSINASKCFNNEFNLANKKYLIPSLENNLNE